MIYIENYPLMSWQPVTRGMVNVYFTNGSIMGYILDPHPHLPTPTTYTHRHAHTRSCSRLVGRTQPTARIHLSNRLTSQPAVSQPHPSIHTGPHPTISMSHPSTRTQPIIHASLHQPYCCFGENTIESWANKWKYFAKLSLMLNKKKAKLLLSFHICVIMYQCTTQ